jgi:LacI family transcriptional regulator
MQSDVKKANLEIIAEKCGVSRMTVSRVLRNSPNVSKGTRRTVLRAAESLGFMPSGSISQSSMEYAKHYSVLFQEEYSLKDTYFSDIILSIQSKLFDHKFGCSLGVISNEYPDFIKLNNILRSQEISGVFVVGEIRQDYAEALQTNFGNVVFIDNPGEPGMDRPYSTICTDNVYGGRLALRHLLNLSRRRILLVAGRKGHYFTNDMVSAYKITLDEYGIDFDPALIVNADFHAAGGYESAAKALASGLEFDAVFSNDEMACGAMRAIQQAGRKIPQDVAVVGFDGLPMGEMAIPPLTTITVNRAEMGRLAVQKILDMEGGSFTQEPEKTCLFPKLLARESCGYKA